MQRSVITIPTLQRMKESGEKITVITAYDYPSARLCDAAGVDVILIGDSVGVVVAGHDTTLPVTMDEMLYHVRAVVRAHPRALILADMPFMACQSGIEQALVNCGRMLKEGGAAAVKIEGGCAMAPVIRAVTAMDIPVVGHVGLTPQSIHRMGGYKVQGAPRRRIRFMLMPVPWLKPVPVPSCSRVFRQRLPSGITRVTVNPDHRNRCRSAL